MKLSDGEIEDRLSERMRRRPDWKDVDGRVVYSWADEVTALEAKLSKMEEALHKAAEQYGEIGAPEVHRTWRDKMVETGLHITDERLDWRGLPAQDIHLDERIARAVAKDFLIWAFGHEEALAGEA